MFKTKQFQTGPLAQILAKKPRKIRQMIDDEILKGRSVVSLDGHGRRSYRVVSYRSLVRYIEEHGGLRARKWLLAMEREELEQCLTQFGLHFDGFLGFVDGIKFFIEKLYPLDTLEGISGDKVRKMVLAKLIRFMDRHIKLRVDIAVSRKK